MGKLAIDVFGYTYDEDNGAFGDEDVFLYHFVTGHHWKRDALDARLLKEGRSYGPKEIEDDRGRHRRGKSHGHLCEFTYYGGHKHIGMPTLKPLTVATTEGVGNDPSFIHIKGGPADADGTIVIEMSNTAAYPPFYIFATVDKGDTTAQVVAKVLADFTAGHHAHLSTSMTVAATDDETIVITPEHGFPIDFLVHNLVSGHIVRPPNPTAIAGVGTTGMVGGDLTKLGGIEFEGTFGGGRDGTGESMANFLIGDHAHPGAVTTSGINGHVSIKIRSSAKTFTVAWTAPAGTTAAALNTIVVNACQALIAANPELAGYQMDLSSLPFISFSNTGLDNTNISFFYISWV